jgi:hypothetical protein
MKALTVYDRFLETRYKSRKSFLCISDTEIQAIGEVNHV